MTTKTKLHRALSLAAIVGMLGGAAALIGPAQANKDPVTPQQLEAYQQVFMEEVRKGDLLFHGDEAMQKQLGVNLSAHGEACAMCHPMASDTHPFDFPKFQASMNEFATLRDMINWCIENPVKGKPLADDNPKLRALEAYILATRKGVRLEYGKH